ncbi:MULTISPECIES: phosphate ABC transporter permease PstA [unclassified Microbacterium]|jgi:phosphate transport system permease protein|uniref:phosphate ABC transporter permease PstA n=1 Tax=unclassified Microbacterium TaxID=2609290 RepID=UPI00160510C2|nr:MULTISPECIES: phosphate ABC transporter permease PstA [unclassified Microbacterium]QNA91467.1 phosphate ABC transporter permease PstA [Microbacterium sp. Se63.02b]QYM64639.1 phosphate ABC transporter permease PstA [Microbacterium sp. Se5.02b]
MSAPAIPESRVLNATRPLNTGRNGELRPTALIFLVLLWLSLFVAFAVLVTLLITIFITGQNKLTWNLVTNFPSADPEEAGARPAILGSVWAIGATAVMTLPLGIAAAVHLEEFADRKRWFNRFVELNVQNLAAVPSIVYGLLALAFLSMLGVTNKNIVIGGAFALTLLILPVIIIATREALRAVPREIRDGSLALGATQWQTTWRQVLPASVPGIATGSILALSRALGEAAPLLVLGALVYITFDPNGLLSGYTTLPIQIFNWTGRPQEGFHELAGATSLLLLAVLILMNALAIFIRNKFQKRW